MKVKGNILKARAAFVTDEFGEEAWARVLAALPEEDRRILGTTIANVAWYPFETGKHLDAAIVEVLGRGNTGVFEKIGRASARENLGGVHSQFLQPGDPQAFMKKASMIYRFYYDVGHRTWEPTGPTSGVLTTYDAETYSSADCATVVGWYKEALGMCGAKQASVVEETCRARGGDHCRYRVSWS